MGLELETKDTSGNKVGTVSVDQAALGGFPKSRLMHAAAVMYHANTRQGSHATKTRAAIAGSTRKLYRQKGTGRARMGNRKSGIRRGGGVIHGPQPRDYSYHMPQKQRRNALRSALLGKAMDGEVHVVSGLDLAEPKTKGMVALINALGLGTDTALFATDGLKRNVYLAARNIPGVEVAPAEELNARALLVHKHLVIDQKAFDALNAPVEATKRARKPKGTRKKKPVKGAAAGGEGE